MSLSVLVEQMNARFPHRDRTSDGWIGDASHQSKKSDHNPWVIDGKTGVVTAQDIDADIHALTVTARQIVDAICRSKDERVKYIIFFGKITTMGTQLQQWHNYTGSNAHKHHIHISVFPRKQLYDSTKLWSIPHEI